MKLYPHEYEFWKSCMVAACGISGIAVVDRARIADNAVTELRERTTTSQLGAMLGLPK
jgi:hypothetical protein